MELRYLMENEVSDMVRAGKTAHLYPSYLSTGRFNRDRTKAKEGMEESIYLSLYVLNAVKEKTRDLTIPEINLIDINDAFACHDPLVKEVVGEYPKGSHPHKEPVNTHHKVKPWIPEHEAI